MRKLVVLIMAGLIVVMAGCGGGISSIITQQSDGDTSELSSSGAENAQPGSVISTQGKASLPESREKNPMLPGELAFGEVIASSNEATATEGLGLAWSDMNLSVEQGELARGAELRIIAAEVPGKLSGLIVGEAFSIELSGINLDEQVILSFNMSGLPLDAEETSYDLYQARNLAGGIEVGFGWAQVENGVLSKSLVYEQGTVYMVVDQDRIMEEGKGVSSFGKGLPLLTTQDPDEWVQGGDVEELGKLNIVFIHGLDMFEFWNWFRGDDDDDDDEDGRFQSSFSKHWEHYAPLGAQIPPVVNTFPQLWLDETTCWGFYYNSVNKKSEKTGKKLAKMVRKQILEIRPDAEIVLVGYSKGAMVSLAAYDKLQTKYGYGPDVVDGMVTLNGASMGSEWVNVARKAKGFFFFGFPKAPGVYDLRSIYNVEFQQPYRSYKTKTKKPNKDLRERLDTYSGQLNDPQWFYPVSSHLPGGFLGGNPDMEIYGNFDELFNAITQIEVEKHDWRPVGETRLHDGGIVKYDGILSYYSQQATGAVGEYEVPLGSRTAYNHGLDHMQVIGTADGDAMYWLREALYAIACRLLNRAPTAALQTTPDPATGPAPFEVVFDASGSTDPEGLELTFDWDFDGDGVIDIEDTTEAVQTHTYETPGNFFATVYVHDCGGAGAALSVEVEVEEAAQAELSWIHLQSMPIKRYGHGVVALDGFIYAVNDGPTSKRVDRYDPTTNSWTKVADTLVGRHSHYVTSAEGKIYSSGGYGVGGTTWYPQMEVYDPGSNTWSMLTPMPLPVLVCSGWGASGYADGKIYHFAGKQGPPTGVSGPPSKSVLMYVYDIATDSWSRGADKPNTSSSAVVELDGKMYLVGGLNGPGPPFEDTVFCYDPVTNSYSSKPALPRPMYACVMGTFAGRIYMLGAKVGYPNGFDKNVYTWMPGESEWSDTGVNVGISAGTMGASLGNRIYYVGGGTGNGTETAATQALEFN